MKLCSMGVAVCTETGICEACGAPNGTSLRCDYCSDWRTWERIERAESHVRQAIADLEPRPLREGEDDHGE